MNKRIMCSLFIFGLLAATSVQAESYRSTVKKAMKTRLEPFSVGIEKLNNGESICGIGIQSSWSRTVVHVSETGASNGLQPGDEILSVNGEQTSDESASYRKLIQHFEANDKLKVSIQRNEEQFDIEAVCVDDSEIFKSQVDMLQFAAKGKWQQCIDKSYAVEGLDGKRTLFSADVRNTCTEAKRCGWKCGQPTLTDARSLYEVNLTELEAVMLANINMDEVRTSILNGISWLQATGNRQLAEDLESRFRAISPAPTVPVPAIPPTVGKTMASET